jgi:hypothetical protein
MRDGKVVAFLIPFNKSMASNHVRAKCLIGYAPQGWLFHFLDGEYPKIFDRKVLRLLYRNLFYFISLTKLKLIHKEVVVLAIKQDSLMLIFLIRKVLGLRLILDINDPIHLHPGLGRTKTLRLLKFADHLIFESPEYKNYWNENKIAKASIVEDTPQSECVFLDFSSREQCVAWAGSPATSQVLLEFIPHLLLFNKLGYDIKLLGASNDVNKELSRAGIKTVLIGSYNHASLVENLTGVQIAFIPMLNIDFHNLRGNLKAKIAMACGCLTIASKNEMHERLIENGKSGFLFDSFDELSSILNLILLQNKVSSKFAFAGNCYVADHFTRTGHASEICRIANELIEQS